VNGATVSITVDDPDAPLLYILRNELGLHGPRFGCGLGASITRYAAHQIP
jgi:nicotinate dehydrogenase subunit A